jgi:hypothetical protein
VSSIPGGKPKSLNSFQIIGRLFSASIGISSSKNREQSLSEASAFAWFGAVAIFVLAHYAFIRVVIHFIRRAAAQ